MGCLDEDVKQKKIETSSVRTCGSKRGSVKQGSQQYVTDSKGSSSASTTAKSHSQEVNKGRDQDKQGTNGEKTGEPAPSIQVNEGMSHADTCNPQGV